MLLRFRVRNYASLRDEQELSLIASDGPEGLAMRSVPGTDLNALPIVGIFGPNASGKSNVIEAIKFAVGVVRDSHQRWLPGEGIDRWAFKLDEASAGLPSGFVFEFVLDDVRYEYGFGLDDVSITEEWLYAWPNNKRQILFAREGQEFRFGRQLAGGKAVIKELVRENSLFLSAGAANNHELLGQISQFFTQNVRAAPGPSDLLTRNLIFPGVVHAAVSDDRLMSLIKLADLGVLGASETTEFEKTRDTNTAQLRQAFRGGQPNRFGSLLHGAAVKSGAVALPSDAESSGTVQWTLLVATALPILQRGGVLAVDDLGGDIHPSLTAQFIKLFLDPETNPHGAQLVFNTHDVTLLWRGSEARLRRDQVWFTEKSADGATSLYPLTDFRVRDSVEDVMGRYLHGRYDAVPFFDDEILHSLKIGG